MMSSNISTSTEAAPPPDTGRLLTYGVAFVGLMGALFGATGLLGLLLAETAFSSRNVISASDARDQGSYFLAALLVCTPIWLTFWRMAQRRIERMPAERRAADRRLFFALVLATTAVTTLFALHTVLRVLLTIPGSNDASAATRDGVSSVIRLLVYGGAGALYTRIAWKEWPTTRRDPARDLALYVVSGFALGFLALGSINVLALLVDQMLGSGAQVLLGSMPSSLAAAYGEGAAWVLAGGATWLAVTSIERRYDGVRDFRVPYLYLVLALSVGMTLEAGGILAYEVLRRALGYTTDSTWQFLHDALPPFLVAATSWAYHWKLLWQQSRLERPAGGDAIPWPRRPYLAALAFVGTALAAVGAVLVLWVLIDIFFPQNSLNGAGWWRDQTSSGIALLAIGTAAGLRAWATLQVAAAADPREHATESRRRLLGGIVALSSLGGVGFAIAFLWIVFRMLFGASHDTTTTSEAIRYLVTALVAAGLIAYFGPILRATLRTGPGAARLRLVALIRPEVEGSVAELSRRIGQRIEVIGYLVEDSGTGESEIEALVSALSAYADAGATRALLVWGSGGGKVYPYSRKVAGVPAAVMAGADLQITGQMS